MRVTPLLFFRFIRKFLSTIGGITFWGFAKKQILKLKNMKKNHLDPPCLGEALRRVILIK
jgi:hypothetical protein